MVVLGRPSMLKEGVPSGPCLVTRGETKYTGPGLFFVGEMVDEYLCLMPNENAGFERLVGS